MADKLNWGIVDTEQARFSYNCTLRRTGFRDARSEMRDRIGHGVDDT